MGKLSREKGAAFERRVANWLNAVLGTSESKDWKRELRETQQGNLGDVRDSAEEWPYVIQCKHMKQPSPFRALKEAREGALQSHGRQAFGIAIIRRHGGENLVAMGEDTLATMLCAMQEDDDPYPGREQQIVDILSYLENKKIDTL